MISVKNYSDEFSIHTQEYQYSSILIERKDGAYNDKLKLMKASDYLPTYDSFLAIILATIASFLTALAFALFKLANTKNDKKLKPGIIFI